MNHIYGVMALLPRSTVLLYDRRPDICEAQNYRRQFNIHDDVDVAIMRFGTFHDLTMVFDMSEPDDDWYIGRAIYLRKPKLLSPITYIGPIATTSFSIPIQVETILCRHARPVTTKPLKSVKVF